MSRSSAGWSFPTSPLCVKQTAVDLGVGASVLIIRMKVDLNFIINKDLKAMLCMSKFYSSDDGII